MRRSNSGGFEGPWELFRLPRQLGDEFFDKSMAFVEGIFGKNAGGLVHLMNEVEGEEDPFQLSLLKQKGEDLTVEIKSMLSEIAKSVKGKAEEAEQRSLKIRIRRRMVLL